MSVSSSRSTKHFTARKDDYSIPNNLWTKCLRCRELIPRRELHDRHKVCPRCDFHFRLNPHEWIQLLFDHGSFQESVLDSTNGDYLTQASYTEKVLQAKERTGLVESIVCGSATINQIPFEAGITSFDFIAGSMGVSYGEMLCQAIERAAERQVPLVTVNSSGGVRVHEGLASLLQMAKVSGALKLLARAQQPHLALLTDTCYGGVFSSYASIADVILVEPCSRVGFAGPRVIKQTIRQQLPPNYQTAEFLLEHGLVDQIVPRGQLRRTLARLLQIYSSKW